jgi:hypothetical protein
LSKAKADKGAKFNRKGKNKKFRNRIVEWKICALWIKISQDQAWEE